MAKKNYDFDEEMEGEISHICLTEKQIKQMLNGKIFEGYRTTIRMKVEE